MSTRNPYVGTPKHPVLALSLSTLLALTIAFGLVLPVPGAETNPTPAQAQSVSSDELLRSYLQLQEQLHSLYIAVDNNRKDTAAAADKSAQQLAGRLNSIELSLNAQRARELEAMQSSNRVMLTVAGTFAGVGLLAMVCMAYFQWRTINRLAEISAGLPAAHLLGPGSTAWGNGTHLLPSGTAGESNARLMGSLDRLEKRLLELEHSAKPISMPAQDPPADESSSTSETNSNGDGEDAASLSTEASNESRLSLLLAKGQSLLNMDRPQEALDAFNEALRDAPKDAEALLKRALAFERLNQLEQALESCDRAIAADSTSTMAYLQKGSLYNRMERFEEAIQCYETALRLRH